MSYLTGNSGEADIVSSGHQIAMDDILHASEAALNWQVRPIFISSTFSDMQAERDHLLTHVFPALEERMRGCRCHLEWVDLRVGVATASYRDAQARERQVLKVCFGEALRCRPFLIVLLGDRYGWVPPIDRVIAAAREVDFGGELAGRSVTDLEIHLGALDNPERPTHSLVYFRTPLPYADMPADIAAAYSDAHDPHPDARDRSKRLATLKHEIEIKMPGRVRHYTASWDAECHAITTLEAWGQSVIEDVWSEFVAAMALASEVDGEITWQQMERMALDDFIEDRARDFIGREPVLVRLEGFALNPEQEKSLWALCLTGAPGSGKSATFGELYRRLLRSNTFVLAHAVGASARAASVETMLRRWIEELAAALDADTGLSADADLQAVEAIFRSLLAQMSRRRRIIVLIDALDQLAATTSTWPRGWLLGWPMNARLIATVVPCEASQALATRTGVETVPLPPLDAIEARGITEAICARYHRVFEPAVLDALMGKIAGGAPAWGNTLWLVLAVEELNLIDADDFARVGRYGGDTPAEQLCALMCDIVAQMPSDLSGLYEAAFKRAEGLFGVIPVQAFLALIAFSRSGWRESDFRMLLPGASGEMWDELRFASLRRVFRGQIRKSGFLGQWNFSHEQMRIAARKHLATRTEAGKESHEVIVRHLLSLSADDPLRLSELMVHLLGSEDWRRAGAFYGTPGLSTGAIAGATRALADTIIASLERSGLKQVLRMINAIAYPVDLAEATITATAADRLFYELDVILAQRTQLDRRAALMGRVCEIFDRLTKTYSKNENWWSTLAACHRKIAAMLEKQGNLSGAIEASYSRGLPIVKRLADSDPTNARWQCELSTYCEVVGRLCHAGGRHSDALNAYQDGFAINQKLMLADPENALLASNLARSYSNVGRVLGDCGKLTDALIAHRKALAISERVASGYAGNDVGERSLMADYCNVGDVLQRLGQPAEALQACQRGHAICLRLAEANPLDTGRQRDLAVSHARIGDILEELGKLPEALKASCEGLFIIERLTDFDPCDAAWQRDLAMCYQKVGKVLIAQGDHASALNAFHLCLRTMKQLVEMDASNATWRADLLTSYLHVCDALFAQGNLYDALEACRSSLAISEHLAKLAPDNIAPKVGLAQSYGTLGRLHAALKNKHEALRCFRRGRLIVLAPPEISEQHRTSFLKSLDADIAAMTEAQVNEVVEAQLLPKAASMEQISSDRPQTLRPLSFDAHPAAKEIAKAEKIIASEIEPIRGPPECVVSEPDITSHAVAFSRLKEAINNAIAVAPTDPDLIYARACLHYFFCQQYYGQRDHEQCLALVPNHFDAVMKKRYFSSWDTILGFPGWDEHRTTLPDPMMIDVDMGKRALVVRNQLRGTIAIVVPENTVKLAGCVNMRWELRWETTPYGKIAAHYLLLDNGQFQEFFIPDLGGVQASSNCSYWILRRLARQHYCFLVIAGKRSIIRNERYIFPGKLISELQMMEADLISSGPATSMGRYQMATQWYMNNSDTNIFEY